LIDLIKNKKEVNQHDDVVYLEYLT